MKLEYVTTRQLEELIADLQLLVEGKFNDVNDVRNFAQLDMETACYVFDSLSLLKELDFNMEKYTVRVDYLGTKYWYDSDNWLHRTDGPAIEYLNGSYVWYYHGDLHREDGPAIENINGPKAWYYKGKRHRTDGPAIEWPSGSKDWYIHGIRYTEEEFNEQVKPTKELTLRQISDILGYDVKIIGNPI